MYLDKAISIATRLGLPHQRHPEGSGYSDGNPCVIVRSVGSKGPRGDCFEFLVVTEQGLHALGDEQGNYAGGVTGRLADPSFPITVGAIARLPDLLRQFLWELQSDLLMQRILPR